eukprot:c32506_g1_i1 orf=164-343(-)
MRLFIPNCLANDNPRNTPFVPQGALLRQSWEQNCETYLCADKHNLLENLYILILQKSKK